MNADVSVTSKTMTVILIVKQLTRQNIKKKKIDLMLCKIPVIPPITTVLWTTTTGHSGVRTEPHHYQEIMLATCQQSARVMFVKYKDGNKLNTLTSHSDNKYRLCTEPYTFLIITIFRRHAAPLFVPISPKAQTCNHEWKMVTIACRVLLSPRCNNPVLLLHIHSCKFYTKIQCLPHSEQTSSPLRTPIT
jgi:hypothetical protein